MSNEAVVVIGAGAIGLSCAYELATSGAEVVVIDTADVGAGASRRNAGWVTPVLAGPVPSPGVIPQALRWMTDPTSPLRVAPDPDPRHVAFMTRMLLASTRRRHEAGARATAELARGTIDAFRRYVDDGVDFRLHEQGVLFAFLSREARDTHLEEYAIAEEYGNAPVAALSAADVAEIEPALSRRVVAGLLSPDQAFVDPNELVDALARRVDALGVRVLTGQSDVRLRVPSAGRVEVSTQTTRIAAGTVVVAAGVGSRGLAEQVGLTIPLRFGKGYGYDISGATNLRHAIYMCEARVAATPLPDRLRLAGTMEFGGDPNGVDVRRARGILSASAKYFEHPRSCSTEPFAGLRPMLPDGLPVIGPVPGVPQVVLATGHAMLGITLAPRTAEVVAGIVRTGEVPDVVAPFGAGRFARSRRRSA